MTVNRVAHWDTVYASRGPTEVSWFQREPHLTLHLLELLGIDPDATVIDIGGGASTLVDRLAGRGFRDLTVLDISAAALDLARARIGADAPVDWLPADVLTWAPDRAYDLWHDRAVFHFMVDPTERDAYLSTLGRAVPDGSVILATFAPDGPDSCSGLPVARYSPAELADLLGGFEIVEAGRDVHITPAGATQPFTFVAARRIGHTDA